MYIIMGAGGSGKSALQSYLINNMGFKRAISVTTRPIRKGERRGIDYIYLTEHEFDELNQQNELLCVEKYNNWGYAIPKNEINNPIAVAVLTPQGASELKKQYGDKMKVIYLNIDRRSCLIKMLQTREDVDECIRRSVADDKMFKHAEDIADIIIYNNNYKKTIEELAQEVCERLFR